MDRIDKIGNIFQMVVRGDTEEERSTALGRFRVVVQNAGIPLSDCRCHFGDDPDSMHEIYMRQIEQLGGALDQSEEALVAARDRVRQLEADLAARPLARAPIKRAPKPKQPWNPTPEQYRTAIDLFIKRKTLSEIAAYFGVSEGTISGKFGNGPPNEHLLGRVIPIRDGGPMDIFEFWKIGYSLYGEGWRKRMRDRFGITRYGIHWSDPTYLDDAALATLRREYHENLANKKVKSRKKP